MSLVVYHDPSLVYYTLTIYYTESKDSPTKMESC